MWRLEAVASVLSLWRPFWPPRQKRAMRRHLDKFLWADPSLDRPRAIVVIRYLDNCYHALSPWLPPTVA